jgi:DNA-directed RNA polymerase subunit RPC12/RpoP
MLETKRFKILNEAFTCDNCGGEVAPTARTTPRDHCPLCLYSKHVDVNPGDRANPCRGLLKPIGIHLDSKKDYIIIYRCDRCGSRVRTKAILEDENGADNMEKIIELSSYPIEEPR